MIHRILETYKGPNNKSFESIYEIATYPDEIRDYVPWANIDWCYHCPRLPPLRQGPFGNMCLVTPAALPTWHNSIPTNNAATPVRPNTLQGTWWASQGFGWGCHILPLTVIYLHVATSRCQQ